jgi:hypothetical protein
MVAAAVVAVAAVAATKAVVATVAVAAAVATNHPGVPSLARSLSDISVRRVLGDDGRGRSRPCLIQEVAGFTLANGGRPVVDRIGFWALSLVGQ